MRVVRKEEVEGFPLFDGVKGRILQSSGRLMFLLVEIEAGGVVPPHSHPHEQMGLCLQGRAEFKGGDDTALVEPGMVYFFEANERHSVRVVGDEKGVFLDVFSPPREDYLAKTRRLRLNTRPSPPYANGE